MRFFPLVILVAGCAGNAVGQEDSNAVLGQLVSLSYSATAVAQPRTDVAPQPLISLDRSLACQAGGSSAISGELTGDIDAATGSGAYAVDLMTTFSDCNAGNGLVIAGAPYLPTEGTFSYTHGELSSETLSYSGALTANGEACNIDVTLTASAPAGWTARGTICGNAVRASSH